MVATRRFRTFSLCCLLAIVLSFAAPTKASKVTFIAPTAGWGPELEEAFTLFQQRTGTEVELINAASWADLVDKVVTMSVGGVAPDVVYGDRSRIFELASQGLLEQIDTYVDADGVNLRVFPAPVLQGLRLKGQLYSMPTAVSIHGLFYNTDLFDKMGLSYLPTDWSGDELGWEDFVSLAKKITVDQDGNGAPETWGVSAFGYSGGFNMLGLWGANDVGPDGKTYTGTDPKVVEALKNTTSLWLEHRVVGGNFAAGTSGMHAIQSYYMNTMRGITEQGGAFGWSVGVLPKGTTRASQASFHSMGVSSGSKVKAEAWELVKFLTVQLEGNTLFTRSENRTPVLREPAMDYIKRWTELLPSSNPQVFAEAVNVLWSWDILEGKGGTEVTALMRSAWARIQSGQVSVAQALEEIAPQAQAILNER